MCVNVRTQDLTEPPGQKPVVSCFFALPDFECITCALLIKKSSEGKDLVAEGKGPL